MAHLFVDNLTVIDFSYLDTERGIVGESWVVDIELAGALDEQGMIFDFGHIKKQIKHYIDNTIDHCLLVPTKATGCSHQLLKDQLCIKFPLSSGAIISHRSPQDAVVLVDAKTISKDHIAIDLQANIKSLLPANVTEVTIQLNNEITNEAYYHYTHGLQKHLGQCQRIAHGHRSRINISIDDERNTTLEMEWAKKLKDIYIATENHIIDYSTINGIPHTQLAYTAQQGYFEISLPREKIFVMPTESTVENIASYLATTISNEHTRNVVVKAYEGLNKGAIGKAFLE